MEREAGMSGGSVVEWSFPFLSFPTVKPWLRLELKWLYPGHVLLVVESLGMEKTGLLLQEGERSDGDLQIIIIWVQEDT